MTTHPGGRLAMVVVAFVVVAMTVAACGTTTKTTTTAGAPTAIGPTAPPATPSVHTTANPKLGLIVVDGAGFTLYHNTQETGSTIVCTGACESAWSPILHPAGSPGGAGPIGVVTRPDGAAQVTYGGMALYRFAGDHQPGDTNGQGVGNVWVVVQADGATAAPGGPATTSPPSSQSATTAAVPGSTTSRPGAATITSAPQSVTTFLTATTYSPITTATTAHTTPSSGAPATTSPPVSYSPTTAGACDYPPCFG